MKSVPVLFCRSDSIYKSLGCDVFDADRDALTFDGSRPVIAHPPCRSWGRLRRFSNPSPGEKNLAFFAVEKVRQNGGVLEHPASSSLWQAAGLPLPRPGFIDYDDFGGFTFPVAQSWFGHRAEKLTWLYIVGLSASDLPSFPLSLELPEFVVAPSRGMTKGLSRPSISKAEREHTPVLFAQWLIQLVTCIDGFHKRAIKSPQLSSN